METLSATQRERYKRNIMLDTVGVAGQEKLLSSRVLVVGGGGLGSPVLMYLAAAGVGTIGIIDGDRVELSNLQRQIVHSYENIGIFKGESAKKKLMEINPDIQITVYNELLTEKNSQRVLSGYDFVVEATDNFPTKFLVNDLCVQMNIPFSHGGILGFVGQTMTVIPGKSCCYRCVFQNPPSQDIAEKCSQAGVLGAIAGVVGSLQAAEVLKYLTGSGDLLIDTLLVYDALAVQFRKVDIQKRQGCICSSSQIPASLQATQDRANSAQQG